MGQTESRELVGDKEVTRKDSDLGLKSRSLDPQPVTLQITFSVVYNVKESQRWIVIKEGKTDFIQEVL